MLLADRDPYNCHLDIMYIVYRTGKDIAMRSIIKLTLDPLKSRQGAYTGRRRLFWLIVRGPLM